MEIVRLANPIANSGLEGKFFIKASATSPGTSDLKTRYLTLTQIQLWVEFENFRLLINDKAFGAVYNVHCPCHPPDLRISGFRPDPRRGILRRISVLRRTTLLATTAMESQWMMARKVLCTPTVRARDQTKN
jgi:hypothetical protein